MSDFYCGSKDKPPKNKRFGNMEECAEAGLIRLYGINKIDQETLEKIIRTKKRRN